MISVGWRTRLALLLLEAVLFADFCLEKQTLLVVLRLDNDARISTLAIFVLEERREGLAMAWRERAHAGESEGRREVDGVDEGDEGDDGT